MFERLGVNLLWSSSVSQMHVQFFSLKLVEGLQQACMAGNRPSDLCIDQISDSPLGIGVESY
jgi:hypothetical protein